MAELIYKIEWMESERGWGTKPFKDTYHLTREDAQQAIRNHRMKEKKRNPSGEVPDWYVFPEGIYPVEATPELIDWIEKL